MATRVPRDLPTPEAEALLELTRELADGELRPRVTAMEAEGAFPRQVLATLGEAGLLGLPYDEEYGGGQPYEVYLQVVEELSAAWVAVGLGVSVHTLACFPLSAYGSKEQKARWLPDMLGGGAVGGVLPVRAGVRLRRGGAVDARRARRRGLPGHRDQGVGDPRWRRRLLQPHGAPRGPGPPGHLHAARRRRHPGLLPQPPERKMGMRSSRTSAIVLDDAPVPAERRLGEEGQGFQIALQALDGGRLGISALSVGLAQAALDYATAYARERRQFGRPVIEFEGVGFLLADMAAGVAAGRALYLAAARRRDRGLPYGPQAAMAKLFCADMAMRVTTDAVQVLGGAGYVEDHPVERYMREAKMLQIVEGTQQVQRLVVSRSLAVG